MRKSRSCAGADARSGALNRAENYVVTTKVTIRWRLEALLLRRSEPVLCSEEVKLHSVNGIGQPAHTEHIGASDLHTSFRSTTEDSDGQLQHLTVVA